MLVAFQKGRRDDYTALFYGKGPFSDTYNLAIVRGEHLVGKAENLTRAQVAEAIRENRTQRQGYDVELHKTVGRTMRVF